MRGKGYLEESESFSFQSEGVWGQESSHEKPNTPSFCGREVCFLTNFITTTNYF